MSLRTYLVTVVGFSCWVASTGAADQGLAGDRLQHRPCLLMSGAVLVLKWRFGRKDG